MKSKTVSAVLMSGAGVVCLVPQMGIADVASPSAVAAPEARPTLQISSEVAPSFFLNAPEAAPKTSKSSSPYAPQWIENPLLKAQPTNAQPKRGVWLDNSQIQLLDAPPQSEGFEIEILPTQPASSASSLQNRLSPARASNAKIGNARISVQTQQAAKIAVERAQLLERAGVPVMAAAQLHRAVSMAPSNIAARRALAQWTSQHEQWPEAAAQWREVLYQLQTQNAAPTEAAQMELWREEATREMRVAQNQLMAFWQVPNVVTLGADSQNPMARSSSPVKPSSTINLARASTALANTKPQVSAPNLSIAQAAQPQLVHPQAAPLVIAMPEPKAVLAPSALENVMAALPNRAASKSELRFDIVITSSSYLRPQTAQIAENMALQSADKTKVANALVLTSNTNQATVAAPTPTPEAVPDSDREQARLLTMQRQQALLGALVQIKINGN